MRGSIILTIQLDERADARLQDMRRRYFPAAQNVVPAHSTLFHNLPGAEQDSVLRAVAEEAGASPPFAVAIAGPRRLGRGVALEVESERLMGLHARLAERFRGWLSGQDRENFRPHVTIQNKVAPHEAAGLFGHLDKTFEPFEAMAEGIQIWRYASGPWRPIAAVAFQGGAA